MQIRWLLVALLIVGSVALIPSAHAETEPNDTRDQATPITPGYTNAIMGATIATTSDVDYYALSTEANRTYVIETYNIDGTGSTATGLWLENETGTEIANDQYGNNGTGSANARSIFTFVTAGTYYIRVANARFSSWTGTYSIRVLPQYDQPGAGWDTNNDNEPNDVPEVANAIGLGLSNAQTHQIFDDSSFVNNNTDRDFYRFEAEANRTYVIETYNIDGTGTDATGLWLYNDEGTEIANDQYGNAGTGSVNARIIFTPTTPGTYFIRVSQARFANWTGTYSMRVLPKYDEPGAAWDASNNNEPNDVIPLAFPLGTGTAQAQRSTIFADNNFVNNGSDQDFYAFTAQAGMPYVIETFGVQEDSSGNGTGLWLYNIGGTEIANDQYGSNEEGGTDARITFTFANPGTYFVRVKAERFSTWTGTYTVRACEASCTQDVYLPLIRR